MTANVIRTEQGTQVTITIQGRFDLRLHGDFRGAFSIDPKGERRYIVDLAGAEHMDSFALGMLLQLRDHAGGKSAAVILSNGSQEIQEILRIANFAKLFTVS